MHWHVISLASLLPVHMRTSRRSLTVALAVRPRPKLPSAGSGPSGPSNPRAVSPGECSITKSTHIHSFIVKPSHRESRHEVHSSADACYRSRNVQVAARLYCRSEHCADWSLQAPEFHAKRCGQGTVISVRETYSAAPRCVASRRDPISECRGRSARRLMWHVLGQYSKCWMGSPTPCTSAAP